MHVVAENRFADTEIIDDLVDTANRLHFRAGRIADREVAQRLRELARQIEKLAKDVERGKARSRRRLR